MQNMCFDFKKSHSSTLLVPKNEFYSLRLYMVVEKVQNKHKKMFFR